MARRKIIPVDKAADFDVAELFFSTTDPKGRITSFNDVFQRISAFDHAELLGAAHNIVRHPDMPKCVFDLFWEYVLAGRPIGAYVKNMTREGEHYWVFALALPIDGGFLSIRLKPTTETLVAVRKLYAQLLATEKGYGDDWRAGMRAAGKELAEALESLGFSSYDEFMARALQDEVAARDQALSARSDGCNNGSAMQSVFRDLATLDALNHEAEAQPRVFAEVSRAINRTALNACICAAQLGEAGRALGVISEQVSEISVDISNAAASLGSEQRSLSSTLEATSFHVSFATLIAEMKTVYDAHCGKGGSADEQRARCGATGAECSAVLSRAFIAAVESTASGLAELRTSMRSFHGITERFAKILLTTRISHVTGRSIAQSMPDGERYSRLLDDMVKLADDATERLESLQIAVDKAGRAIRSWRLDKVAC